MASSSSNVIGGAQGNTGTVIIGKNPLIDNPLDPWWDIQGAVNSGASSVNAAGKLVNSVGSVVNTVSSGVSDTFSVTNFLSQGSSWKAIGLILAGAIMLILAIVEFTAGGAVRMVTAAAP